MDDPLERAKAITCELLCDRGFTRDTILVDEDNITAQNDVNNLLVVFINETKLSINTLKDIISLCEREGQTHLILVYKDSVTASAKKTLESINTVHVELFGMNELLYNPTKHELSSKHELADAEEAAEIKRKHGANLPWLLRSDKIVRWYSYKPGDIIRVTRPSGHVIYRIVK